MAEIGIASQGTWAIVRAMQATGARRIVVVSAAPIGTVPSPDRPKPPKHDPGDGFFMRLVSPMLKAALTYRTAYGQNLRRGLFIGRADVAHLMLRVLERSETIKEAIGIAY
jgi:hypothetical protein